MNPFSTLNAIKLNRDRLEHLKNIDFLFRDKSIIELGCGGQGDFSKFLNSLTKNLTVSDARQVCLDLHAQNFPNFDGERRILNIVSDNLSSFGKYNIVFCYGLMYHVSDIDKFISNISLICSEFCIIESRYTNRIEYSINYLNEPSQIDQSVDGVGCRPTLQYIKESFKKEFDYLYFLKSLPENSEFDQTIDEPRTIFIASKVKLNLPKNF